MRALRWLLHPARVVPAAYLLVWSLGTVLLSLPVASRSGQPTNLWVSGFTAMSSLCVTGLTVVDTATYWSLPGQLMILGLIQVGGFGIVTLTALVLFSVAQRTNLSLTRVATRETKTTQLAGARYLPRTILLIMLASEALVAVVLTLRFAWGYQMDWPDALYHGVFHSISAYNNAGFALYSDNLMGFSEDAWVILPICAAVMAGGLGFPVYLELLRRRSQRRPFWSVHARLTIVVSLLLFVVGFVAFALFEWGNPATLGSASSGGKVLGAIAGSVFPRTAGFNAVDYSQVTDSTIAINFGLMMIGGGSGGTAGGLKVTTLAVLLLAVYTELRGEAKTLYHGRKISSAIQRQALSVTALATAAVFTAILLLSVTSGAPLKELTFEAISAFGTVGLSMNLTPTLPPASWAVLMGLMFLGRVGPVTVAAALTLADRHRHFEYPKEDPFVG